MNYHINMRKQRTYISKIFDSEFCKVLAAHGAFVAGGAISCLFTDRPINDFDIFFKDSNGFDAAQEYLKKTDNWKENFASNLATTYSNQKQIAMDDPCEYGKTIVIGNMKIQLVTGFFGDVKDIFNTFDFYCCMGAYRFDNGEFEFDPQFFGDNMSKTLRYNYDGAVNALTTLFRVDKYKKYGYSLPMDEMMKIVFAIKKIKLDTIRDLKEFLRMLPPGVYKRVLLGELINKPLEEMRINFNNPELVKKYHDFMNGPCSMDSVVAVLSDMDSYINKMQDDILAEPVSKNDFI